MQIFDALRTREALPFDRLIPALRSLFAQGCVMPPRHVHEVAAPGGGHFTSLIMPAWLEGRYYGIKTINIAPGNAGLGLPGLHASYLLHDAVTGVPLALIDGDQITTRRTAAASALAASFLARPDAKHLLVVGAGRVARLLPQAYQAVLPVERVTVWARAPAKAEAFAAELRAQGMAAAAAGDLEAAVRQADIVSCATLATEPVVRGAWLRPDSHLDLIGSFTPAMREADDACFAGAALYIDAADALAKSGELLGPMARGVFQAGDVRATLAALARGEDPGRRPTDGRTVFKSVGIALEDLAAAMLVHEKRLTGAALASLPKTLGACVTLLSEPGLDPGRDKPQLWLGSSPLLDLEDPKLRLREQSITQLSKGGRQKALAIYSFVKHLPFAKQFKMRLHTAREVLDQRSGDAADKATLAVALFRLAAIPARMRYLTLNGEVMRGLLAGMPEPTRPVLEIFRNGHWLCTDTFIFDPKYMAAARERLRLNAWSAGYGIHAQGDAVWDGNHSAYLTGRPTAANPMLLEDHGVFCDPLEFQSSASYRARHARLARAVRWNLFSIEMERSIRALREGAGGW